MKTSEQKEKSRALNELVERELAKTERIRLIILLSTLIFALSGAFFDSLFIQEEMERLFMSVKNFYKILLFAIPLLGAIGCSLIYVNRQIRLKKSLSVTYKILTAIVEPAFPCVILIAIVLKLNLPILIDSPATFIYVPILIISILHLDYRITLLNGLVITANLLIIYHTAFTVNDVAEIKLELPEVTYYVKALMFLIASLCAAFVSNRLRRRIEAALSYRDQKNEIQLLFSQQVSKQVVDALVQQQDGSIKRKVTILFLDIRGFTNMMQGKPPEEVIAFQNRFFSPIIDIINKYDGITNQILGDGLMATFGAPVEIQQHEKVALNAAMEIVQEVERQNEVKIGIGIHSGEVVTGNIGNNSRKQFSVSGSAVIIASRLEQLNKEFQTKMLVSKNYFEEISDLVEKWENLGRHQLKGIEKEIEVIKIL